MQQNVSINPEASNKDLIVSLIKDDLINNKLVSGLTDLGLCAGDYHLNLSETILTLLGLETEDDAIHDLYFNLTQQSNNLDLSDIATRDQQLTALTTKVYNQLCELC
jgi:hypothetical protein